jgi:hypothetical protein
MVCFIGELANSWEIQTSSRWRLTPRTLHSSTPHTWASFFFVRHTFLAPSSIYHHRSCSWWKISDQNAWLVSSSSGHVHCRRATSAGLHGSHGLGWLDETGQEATCILVRYGVGNRPSSDFINGFTTRITCNSRNQIMARGVTIWYSGLYACSLLKFCKRNNFEIV